MGRDAFKSKRASSVSISGVIDTGVNSNLLFPDHHFCILLTTYHLLLTTYYLLLTTYYLEYIIQYANCQVVTITSTDFTY